MKNDETSISESDAVKDELTSEGDCSKKPSTDFKRNIRTRLKRIEGQVKGIENMVDKNCCCKDVLVQIAAIRAAINKVGGLILENYAKECMLNSVNDTNSKDKIEDLVSTLSMFLK